MRGKAYFSHKSQKFRVQAVIKYLTMTRVMFLFKANLYFLRKEMISNSLSYSYLTLMHGYSKDWQNSEIPLAVWCYTISFPIGLIEISSQIVITIFTICNRNFTEQHCHHLTFIECMIYESGRRCAAETVSLKQTNRALSLYHNFVSSIISFFSPLLFSLHTIQPRIDLI